MLQTQKAKQAGFVLQVGLRGEILDRANRVSAAIYLHGFLRALTVALCRLMQGNGTAVTGQSRSGGSKRDAKVSDQKRGLDGRRSTALPLLLGHA